MYHYFYSLNTKVLNGLIVYDNIIKQKQLSHYLLFCEGKPPVTSELPAKKLAKLLNKQWSRLWFQTKLMWRHLNQST